MLGVSTAGRVLNAKTARSQAIAEWCSVGIALEEGMTLDSRFGYFVNRTSPNTSSRCTPISSHPMHLPCELDNESNPLKSKGIVRLGSAALAHRLRTRSTRLWRRESGIIRSP